jgi:cytochrome c553
MSRHLAAALAATLLAWLAPFGQAGAQTGQSLYTNGPPGAGSARCAQSGCHNANPQVPNGNGNVMNAAGSLSAIYTAASRNPGMNAAINAYSDAQLQSIADWLLSLLAGPTPPSCTLVSTNTTPGVGTSITLTASCTGSPTSYSWTGCASTGPTCTRTETTTGSRTYSVTATNAGGTSAPARISINWQATAGPPTPTPTPTPTPPPEPSPTPVPPPPTSTVVEYYHTGFGHYFITSFTADISALDSGKFAGWARTGRTFNAYTSSNGYVTAVCRFFTVAFPPKSSHFYTSNFAECRGLQASNKDWTFEAEAFYVQQASEQTGSCPTGYRAVYRLYNNGQSGAPNHRYTTDPAVRIEMMGKGWIPEGFGPEGVGFCSPN